MIIRKFIFNDYHKFIIDGKEHRETRRHAQLVYEDTGRAFTELSKSLLTNAQIEGSGGLQLRRRPLVRALVCYLCHTGEVSWYGQ